MVPEILSLGPIHLYSFGAMLALAFLASAQVVGNELERRGISRAHLSPIVWCAAVGGVGGSRVLAIIEDWDQFLVHPMRFLLTGAGFVFYGGLIGGFLAVSAYILWAKLPWSRVVDCIAPGLALGHAIGRVGCQLAGDGDWGEKSTVAWAMTYPRAISGWAYAPGVRVHPSPVYESLAYCLVFVVLLRMLHRSRRVGDGSVFAAYLGLVGVSRFLIEIVSINPRIAFGLSEAQWISIALAGIGGFGVARGGFARARGTAASLLLLVLSAPMLLPGCSASDRAPDFVAQDLAGQAVRLSNLRGKVVFLNLWATWCPPCREEMPAMQALATRLAGLDFVMLAVSQDDEAATDAVRTFVKGLGLTFPVLLDPTGDVGRKYGVTGYPETFLIDRDGKLVAKFIGPREWMRPGYEQSLRTLVAGGGWVDPER